MNAIQHGLLLDCFFGDMSSLFSAKWSDSWALLELAQIVCFLCEKVSVLREGLLSVRGRARISVRWRFASCAFCERVCIL